MGASASVPRLGVLASLLTLACDGGDGSLARRKGAVGGAKPLPVRSFRLWETRSSSTQVPGLQGCPGRRCTRRGLKGTYKRTLSWHEAPCFFLVRFAVL